MKGPFRSIIFWPSCLTAIAMIALAIGVQLYSAFEADRSALARDEHLVQNGIAARLFELGRRVVAQSVWDDAVANLDTSFDPAWAQANVGRFFADVENFEAAIVIDRDDQPVFAMRHNETVGMDRIADIRQGMAPLIGLVRAAEQRRGPLDPILAAKRIPDPIVFSGIIRASDGLYVFSAALVQPDFGTAMPRAGRAAIIVTGEEINADFIELLTDRFLLTEAYLKDGDVSRQGGARAPFRDIDGNVLATLLWTPPTVGTDLLQKSLPTVLGLILCLCAVASYLFQNARRATRDLIASEARNSHLATHDTLTGLANRALLYDRLGHALKRLGRTGETFAVHCIDLDRFKEINDTFGHEAGDDLLRAAAQMLRAECKQSDTPARLGGDEFVIVQQDICEDSASRFAEGIMSAFREPIDLAIGRVHIGCSVGTSFIRNGFIDPPECLRQADLALYKAKAAGRGRLVLFQAQMDEAMRLRQSLQADLRQALQGDDIWIAYQPQVNGVGKVVGVEALARWRHSERGEIAPSIFVPLAEESGLIESLGMRAFHRACEDSTRFGDLIVAVNISAAQLRLTTFLPQLQEVVQSTRVDPTRIELEITEGLLLGDDGHTHNCLKLLRAMGFRIALDDFGTGYSSLSYLHRYPIDKIKIDRSFITNLGIDDGADAVVTAIVRLAAALNLSVIAEGVETEGQRLRLAALGCTNVQGYLFGRPMPADRIEEMVRRYRLPEVANG